MKKIYSFFATVALAAGVFAQTTLTEWNFDNSTTDPSAGSGTVTLIGGVTPNVQTTGTPPCNCAFVQGNPTTGKAYTTTTYPAQGTGSGTAGIQFNVSTVGYGNIKITTDVYGSNTASKYIQLQYTFDGANWENAGGTVALEASKWSTLSYDISAPASNNPNFAFRVVAVFDPSSPAGKYAAIGSSSSYAVTGALRYDNARVTYGVVLSTVEVNGKKVAFVKSNLVENTIVFGAKGTAKIYNLNGQLLKTASVYDGAAVDVSSLPKGMYVVAGEVDGQMVSQKFIKK